MTQISEINDSLYTTLCVSRDAVPGTLSQANYKAMFATAGQFLTFPNVRDFPSFGNSSNLINVPEYNITTSRKLVVQGDLTEIDIKVNYIPNSWLTNGNTYATTGLLADAIGDNISKGFMLAITNKLPANYTTATTGPTVGGTLTAPILNSLFFFVGRIETLEIEPARDEALQATIRLSVQADVSPAYTTTVIL